MKKPLLNRWRHAGRGRLSPLAAVGLGLGLALTAGIAAAQQAPADPPKVLRLAFPVAETNFDPAQISDLYSNTITGHIFESLLTYDYLARPARLKPLTAQAMPEVSSDFKTYTVRIRPGIYFTPDPESDRVYGPAPLAWGLPVAASGAAIASLTETTVTVRTGADFRIPSAAPGVPGQELLASGFVRVVLMSVSPGR